MTAQVEPGIEHTQSEYIFPGESGGKRHLCGQFWTDSLTWEFQHRLISVFFVKGCTILVARSPVMHICSCTGLLICISENCKHMFICKSVNSESCSEPTGALYQCNEDRVSLIFAQCPLQASIMFISSCAYYAYVVWPFIICRLFPYDTYSKKTHQH